MQDDKAPPFAMKDRSREHPIAASWRPSFREVISRFAAGDYSLSSGITGVDPISPETAEHIRSNVLAYGATLTALPEAVWATSRAQWYDSFWDVLIDLWTLEEGQSDLVLQARVLETEAGVRFTIYMVYVP